MGAVGLLDMVPAMIGNNLVENRQRKAQAKNCQMFGFHL